MRHSISRIIRSVLGLGSESHGGVSLRRSLRLLLSYNPLRIVQGWEYIKLTRGQLSQDLFVALETNFKQNGFFVEFGASDGITLSNTYLLETALNWRGILAEPGKSWTSALRQNRAVKISTKAVWSESAKSLNFEEYAIGELSRVSDLPVIDENQSQRVNGVKYQVETISLNDLLETFQAPDLIDVVSIDTEGSELEILKKFNFDRFNVRIFIIEHAYGSNAQEIQSILERNGYELKLQNLSAWDYWFVKKNSKSRSRV